MTDLTDKAMDALVAFLCHSDELRGREVQGWLAETISLAINGAKP